METDYDRIKAYLHKHDTINYSETMDAGGTVIEIEAGYIGFHILISFDKDGNFAHIGAYE